ncbi:MAG: hypothetical protein QOG80_216 [Pseudonocardiales bacterium]|jgi:hypothetical protein|nr:hypothetical protein [Pseudonocardiales bacterium]
MTKPSRTLTIACVTISLALVAACSSHHAKKVAASSAIPTPTPTPTTSSAAPKPKVIAVNPFTGGTPSRNGVVAVKIDDTANGRPQVNIDRANIVYVEQVEGGLTRLVAVYNTSLPTVEAVRSVRANDPELLAQYGPIAFAASGGAPNPLFVLDHSSLKTSINDRGGPGFARDGSRGAPYNLTANLAQVGSALHAPRGKDIGLVWSAAAAKAAVKKPLGMSVRTYVGATPVQFDWNPGLKKYVRLIGGVPQHAADGAYVSTPNVIVQFCDVTPYPQDVDVMGNVAKFTHSIGKGRAVVFRNGHRIEGRWTRSSANNGTHFTSLAGNPISLSPGGAWVLLVATGAPLG